MAVYSVNFVFSTIASISLHESLGSSVRYSGETIWFGESVGDPLIDRGFSCGAGLGSLPELLHPGKWDLGFRGWGSRVRTIRFPA